MQADNSMVPSACLMGLRKTVYFTLFSGSRESQKDLCLKFPVVVDFHSELDSYVFECEA